MGVKEIAVNRKAFHDYEIIDKFEAGLVLVGTEIKSLRNGKVQLKDSYISIIKNEAYIKGMNIATYEMGNRFNHDEERDRKLLLHRDEIIKLYNKSRLNGFTIIPLRIYLSKGKAKMEIALARGKNLHDKRESDKERSMKMEALKAMRY